MGNSGSSNCISVAALVIASTLVASRATLPGNNRSEPIQCDFHLTIAEPQLPPNLVGLPDPIQKPLDADEAYGCPLTLTCQQWIADSWAPDRPGAAGTTFHKAGHVTFYKFAIVNLSQEHLEILVPLSGHIPDPVYRGQYVYGATWVQSSAGPDYSIYDPRLRFPDGWKAIDSDGGFSRWMHLSPGGMLNVYETSAIGSDSLECLLLSVPFRIGAVTGVSHLHWTRP